MELVRLAHNTPELKGIYKLKGEEGEAVHQMRHNARRNFALKQHHYSYQQELVFHYIRGAEYLLHFVMHMHFRVSDSSDIYMIPALQHIVGVEVVLVIHLLKYSDLLLSNDTRLVHRQHSYASQMDLLDACLHNQHLKNTQNHWVD